MTIRFLLTATLFTFSTVLIAAQDRYLCLSQAKSQPVIHIDQLSGFETLDHQNILIAQKAIPPQPQYSELKAWSCSQNSIARAITLVTGTSPFASDQQYINFAHTVPKAIGLYRDHRFDEELSFRNPAVYYTHAALNWFYIPSLFQRLLSYQPFNAGMSPEWLATYMNHYKHDLGLNQLQFDAVATSDFDSIKQHIKTAIRRGNGVIALVVYSPMIWHYLNIVGFSEITRSVVIMDTDSNLRIWSYNLLECLLNLREGMTYFLLSLASQITALDTYNLLTTSRYLTNGKHKK